MTDYAHGRTYYLPSDWMDEGPLPTLAAAPIDFVEQDKQDGSWWLRLPVGDENREEAHYQWPLEVDEPVSWCERRIYGSFYLTIREDGEWFCNVPTDANNFALSDSWSEDTFETIEELIAKGNPEGLGTRLGAGVHDIDAWHWGNDVSLLFELIDGKPSLREVGRA